MSEAPKWAVLALALAGLAGIGTVFVAPLKRTVDGKQISAAEKQFNSLTNELNRLRVQEDALGVELEEFEARLSKVSAKKDELDRLDAEKEEAEQRCEQRVDEIEEVREQMREIAAANRSALMGSSFPEVKKADGKKLTDVKVIGVSAAGVKLEGESGRWLLKPDDLTEEVRIALFPESFAVFGAEIP